MGFLEQVHAKRKKLADVLVDEEYSGIRGLVEELYPDKAHFIYELLQNAEDTGATDVTFSLYDDRLVFEHNGRPFSEADVEGITNIGKGSKRDDDETIGKFGVGFKAVFAYTETPRIWSPTYAFQIESLVLPSKLTAITELGGITRFEFPFNNLKKRSRDAYIEVLSGLDELATTALLFLSHIGSIRWRVPGKLQSEILRTVHSGYHVEVRKKIGKKTISRSHFLRFTQPIDGLEKQNIAIAFALDALPNVKNFNSKKLLAKQYRIVPASPGRVAVFFPAEKETSGLRFHLHAPFVPELSRASIKDTPANQPLFSQLADLVVSALAEIRNLRMLNGDFLAVLPNSHDQIPERYQCIREAVITAMNEKSLTPTYSKSHAPAKNLLQSKASLKKLLTVEDLEKIVDYDEEAPRWAIGAKQKNSDVDHFLSSLDISDWGIEQFVEVLDDHLEPSGWYWDDEINEDVEGLDPELLAWLSGKSEEWHQKLYAMFYRELEPGGELGCLEGLCVVLLENGKHSLGEESYFSSDELEHDLEFPRVAKQTYMSGKGKKEQDDAKKFLERIGVREVDDAVQVEAILEKRYSKKVGEYYEEVYEQDLSMFLSLMENETGNGQLFKNYWIFEGADGVWKQPSEVYLDTPYFDTGLKAYYDAFGDAAKRVALADSYSKKMIISKKRLAKFSEAVGASTRLKDLETSCRANPDWNYLRSVPGERNTSPINRDFVIPGLELVLRQPTISFARILWKTVIDLPKYPNHLKACFQRNETNGAYYSDSQLVHQLRNNAWIPQGTDSFVRPAEASRDLLPKGFPYDVGWSWLEAIHFGKEIERQSKEHQRKRELAIELGFNDDDSLNDGKQFAALDPEERQRILCECESRGQTELPDHESANPERRAFRVRKQADEAPDRVTEKRTRSVSVEREAVKKETAPYLRRQYQNSEGEMICQVCKEPLPFKLEDGNYYFEAVEFLAELRKHHYQNYLALCPNHAAMYQYANGTRELKELFLANVDNEVEVVLAGQDTSIYFTKMHISDLKTIIESDDNIQVR